MYTSSARFNDSYFLKIGQTWQWSQPPNQKSGGEPKNAESKIGAPAPRSHHSATKVGNRVFIFGGIGGVGFKRKVFNDLYVIDLDSYEW
jgi:dynein heavy chain